MKANLLLPVPREVRRGAGYFVLLKDVYVVMKGREEVRDVFAGEDFCRAARKVTGMRFHLVVGEGMGKGGEIRVRFEEGVGHEQGYRLVIGKEGVEIAARTEAGVFYGLQTLLQVLRNARAEKGARVRVACGVIEDWPDFERRGFYLDVSRGKVPTVETILQIVEDLGRLKYNEFQLYVENVFEFRRHPGMYDDTDPLTAAEILRVDAACRERHIDFVPSMASLGHFDKILRRKAYRHLAEVEPEELKKAGIKTWCDDPWTLCVTDEGAKELLKEMVDEFVPNFTSSQFNICCDESWDLGKGRSKEVADKIGVGQLYVEWVKFCEGLARGHGRRVQMWGDIILNHPELISQLPADATLLEWGYESHHAFEEHLKLFKERGEGREFYAAPGTASWLSFASRSRNALGNIANAARAGMKHGAKGLLVTDWGDHGHQQLWAVSLVALAYGAGAGWNVGSCVDPSVEVVPDWTTGMVKAGNVGADRKLRPFLEAASVHVLGDATGTLAGLAYELGLTYERFAWQRFNGSIDWFLFREKWEVANYVNRVEAGELRRVVAACERLMAEFEKSGSERGDGKMMRAEFVFTCKVIVHACKRTMLRMAWLAADPAGRNAGDAVKSVARPRRLPVGFQKAMAAMGKEARGLKKEFSALWRKRNKESRLEDVRGEFRRLREEYRRFA
jgi:hexosaminidase